MLEGRERGKRLGKSAAPGARELRNQKSRTPHVASLRLTSAYFTQRYLGDLTFRYARRWQEGPRGASADQGAARSGLRPDHHPQKAEGRAQLDLSHEAMSTAAWHNVYAVGDEQEEWTAEGPDG